MSTDDSAEALARLAVEGNLGRLVVRSAQVALDARLDGEPVTRVILLLDDPAGDTWSLERVIDLRRAIGRLATDLGLPAASVTLVPLSEAELVEAFCR